MSALMSVSCLRLEFVVIFSSFVCVNKNIKLRRAVACFAPPLQIILCVLSLIE